LAGVLAELGCVTDGVDDRQSGEQAGDDRQQDRRAHPDRSDEGERDQWAADRAEVVHRALEAVGAPVGAGRHDLGQERVARGDAQAACRPGGGAQHPDLPDASRDADQP
jgi:hypothetical protein